MSSFILELRSFYFSDRKIAQLLISKTTSGANRWGGGGAAHHTDSIRCQFVM